MKRLALLRKLITVLIVIFVASFVYYGQVQYSAKVKLIGDQAVEAAKKTDGSIHSIEGKQILALAKNLPLNVTQKLKSKEKVTLLIVQKDEKQLNDYTSLLERKLKEKYGEGVWDIYSISYEAATSSRMIEDNFISKINNYNADLVLFELPILNDNWNIVREKSLNNIEEILSQIHKTTSIILQPNEPLYQSTYYPKDVTAAQNFLVENKYTFLNIWKVYPDINSSQFLNFVNEDQRTLNAKGEEVWANYLANYFTGK